VSQIIWTPNALLCVQRLHDFLKDKNPAGAQRVVKAIRDGVAILKNCPRAGKPVKDMGSEYRQWPIAFGKAGYAVLYRYSEKEITILSVKHQSELNFKF